MAHTPARWTRRRALGWGVGLTVAGSVVGGVMGAAPVAAAAAPITLVWRPWYNFPNGTGQAALALMQQGISPWLAKHPGVKVEITTLGYQGATIAAMLSGTGPDVFEDWVLPPYIENNLVYNIYPYIQQDNVNLSIFPSGEMTYFFDAAHFAPGGGSGLYCLPAYIHTLAMAVNEGILDQMGLTYPEPDWTWEQWTHLWTATTIRSKDPTKQRYGGNLYWSGYDYYGGNNPAPFYLKGFGGGYVDPNDATRSFIDQPGSIQCLEWAFNLMNEGVLGSGTFHTGHQVSTPRGTAGGLPYSASAWQSVKWNFYAMPVWPKGRYTFAASDFYAIYAGTKRPDIAWSFLKFLCVDTAWQSFMMRLALNGPNQKGLYAEWERVVQAVAPPLRTKNLGVIVQAVQNDEPYFGHTFQYADAQAAAIINKYTALAQARQMTVAQAAAEIAKQVNALEATGRSVAAATAARDALIARIRTATTPVKTPPPPLVDSGTAPLPEPKALVYNARTGTYQLSATTAGPGNPGLHGGSTGALFAGSPYTSTQGTFTCRLTSVVAPKGVAFGGAKFGLMAASSLGSGGAEMYVATTVGNGSGYPKFPGVHVGYRPFPGVGSMYDRQTPADTVGPGVIPGARFELSTASGTGGNVLKQPIWFRLVLDGITWRAFTSLDGHTWEAAGSPTQVLAAGWWVGLVLAAPHATQPISATFDHVSGFAPQDEVVRIGPVG
jgi:ABC-type glycerol-3-phosphate transport system substrate-binding protein